MRSISNFVKMRIYCVFRKGAVEGSLPVDVCFSMDSARRSIKSRGGECFIVVRYIRTEYGLAPETIEAQLEPRRLSGRNIYSEVTPFKVKRS